MVTNADEATVFLYINQLYNWCSSIKISARETIRLWKTKELWCFSSCWWVKTDTNCCSEENLPEENFLLKSCFNVIRRGGWQKSWSNDTEVWDRSGVLLQKKESRL